MSSRAVLLLASTTAKGVTDTKAPIEAVSCVTAPHLCAGVPCSKFAKKPL